MERWKKYEWREAEEEEEEKKGGGVRRRGNRTRWRTFYVVQNKEKID